MMTDIQALHILVIENDAKTRAELRAMLELDGHRVEAAASLRVALERRDWIDIAAVIVDRGLPEGSIVDLLMKMDGLAPNMPVIVITAEPDVEETIAALREGAYDYLLKPINPDALRARLRRIGERRSAERQLAASEARNRALLDAIPDTMLRIDSQGLCLDFRAHRDNDVSMWPQDLIGRSIQESKLSSDVVDRLLETVERALAECELQTLEYSSSAAGESRHFEARIVGSGADEVVVIIRDVTW